MKRPRIALTIGDPAGIGPEICLKALHSRPLQRSCDLILIGDKSHLQFLSKKLKIPFLGKYQSQMVDLQNLPKQSIVFGKVNAISGRASGEYLKQGIAMAMKNEIQALVTAPINKESFLLGGWGRQFRGHTEMLAALTGSKSVAMMLLSKNLRTVYVTSHVSLSAVPKLITRSRVLETISLAYKGMRQLGIANPKIGVSALNPHGGEHGMMGHEEIRVIFPAIRLARQRKYNVKGPFSSDALWPMVDKKIFDVGVAMYHDQGQIPVKLNAFSIDENGRLAPGGVNVTLGLPIVRTSPAHGSAYDIAGRGRASERSLVEAIVAAIEMVP